MTEKYKIMSEFVKDMSSETPDIKTYLFVKDNIHNYHLNNIEEHTKKYPDHLKKFFLSKFKTEYSKITNRITAEKFIFRLPRHIQGYCKDNWMYNQLRDIVYSYAATKHKYKAICLIEKLQKRRQAIFYISKVREDGTLTVGDNEKLKRVYFFTIDI